MSLKKFAIILISISLIFLQLITCVFAEQRSSKFKDISPNHWANEQINSMVERKIISGFSDSTFKPDNVITRAEFAKLMVLTLNIPSKKTEVSTFKDVYSDDWVFPYVEGAKYYLTGFRTPNGDYFRPTRPAAREDMAVALVKALGYTDETIDINVLKRFADRESISPNLKKYVAIAVKHNIIQGYQSKDKKTFLFNPQNPLTRAEAAVLLFKVMKEEKVTYDKDGEVVDGSNDEEINYNNDTQIDSDMINSLNSYEEEPSNLYETKSQQTNSNERNTEYQIPKINGKVDGSKIILRWNPIYDKRLQGYKVVISRNNSNPKYPDDGYLYWITNKNTITAIIDNREPYKNGDFGKNLTPGEKYYFSITAVYNDVKVPGNAIVLTFPDSEKPNDTKNSAQYSAPHVTASVSSSIYENKIMLNWHPIIDSRLQGYKVVISKNTANPKYPENGYLYWITDKNRATAVIDNKEPYKNGDFGKHLVPGKKYYFSVTAIYNDVKISGNTLYLTFPGGEENQ